MKTRSLIYTTRGMVATSQPLAVAAGLEILRQGGNAADAAIATAAALNVTEPTSTGIGGDAFGLYYDAKTGQITALNGSGHAPAALTLEKVNAQFSVVNGQNDDCGNADQFVHPASIHYEACFFSTITR